MLHASGPSGYSLTLNVTSSAWYSGGDNWRTVGSVVDDTECKTKTGDPGWRGFHVHQDFMPPETSVESCQWNMNTSTDFHTGVTDRRRDDPDIWYIYSVSYVPRTPCLNPGPKVADKLLAPDGALDGDGNGAGTRALATGAQSSVTSPQTCITGTSWCGTITATPPVVVGAYNYYRGFSPADYLRAQQKSAPPASQSRYWYDNQGAYFRVVYWNSYDQWGGSFPWGDEWGCHIGSWPPSSNPIYYVDIVSTPTWKFWWPDGQNHSCGPCFTGPLTAIDAVTSCLRVGANNETAMSPWEVPQQDANTWAQTQIDSGHWADAVKPALDAVIRAAASTPDMATLGITGNPPFDGDFGQVELADALNRMNTLASRITGPLSSNWTQEEANRDWIGSTRLRWNPTRKISR